MVTCETAAQFIEQARRVRTVDADLENDIRYLWWALYEIRICTAEPMEVLDCSTLCDGLFASLMALRMKPCEAHFLGSTKRGFRAEALMPGFCGVMDYVVPILDGKVPPCNPYDVVIIDPLPLNTGRASSFLRDSIACCAWSFTRIFIRHGGWGHEFAGLYQKMRKTFTWSAIPHTTIVLGHMSEEWCHNIAPPS